MQKVDIATKFVVSLASMVGADHVALSTIIILVLAVVGGVILKKVIKHTFLAIVIVVVAMTLTGVPIVGHYNSLSAEKVLEVGKQAYDKGLINDLQSIMTSVQGVK